MVECTFLWATSLPNLFSIALYTPSNVTGLLLRPTLKCFLYSTAWNCLCSASNARLKCMISWCLGFLPDFLHKHIGQVFAPSSSLSLSCRCALSVSIATLISTCWLLHAEHNIRLILLTVMGFATANRSTTQRVGVQCHRMR